MNTSQTYTLINILINTLILILNSLNTKDYKNQNTKNHKPKKLQKIINMKKDYNMSNLKNNTNTNKKNYNMSKLEQVIEIIKILRALNNKLIQPLIRKMLKNVNSITVIIKKPV